MYGKPKTVVIQSRDLLLTPSLNVPDWNTDHG